jgi:enediyne biosynthesis protein E4
VATLRINTQSNLMSPSVSYAASIHTPVHFGLGTTKLVEKLEVLWPSGKKQTLLQIPSNQLLQITEPD